MRFIRQRECADFHSLLDFNPRINQTLLAFTQASPKPAIGGQSSGPAKQRQHLEHRPLPPLGHGTVARKMTDIPPTSMGRSVLLPRLYCANAARITARILFSILESSNWILRDNGSGFRVAPQFMRLLQWPSSGLLLCLFQLTFALYCRANFLLSIVCRSRRVCSPLECFHPVDSDSNGSPSESISHQWSGLKVPERGHYCLLRWRASERAALSLFAIVQHGCLSADELGLGLDSLSPGRWLADALVTRISLLFTFSAADAGRWDRQEAKVELVALKPGCSSLQGAIMCAAQAGAETAFDEL